MQLRVGVFGILAIISFLVSFSISFTMLIAPNSFTFAGTNSNITAIFIAIWGLVFSIWFGFLAWRNEVASATARKHEEMMEGLKAIYRVMRVQLDDAPPPPNNRGSAKAQGQPGVGFNTWYDLTPDEREMIRKHRG